MPNQPASLSAQLVELRIIALSGTPVRGWIIKSLIAMIMAALARIFGRLDQLVQLWQAGQLPAQLPHNRLVPSSHPEPAGAHGPFVPRAPRHLPRPSRATARCDTVLPCQAPADSFAPPAPAWPGRASLRAVAASRPPRPRIRAGRAPPGRRPTRCHSPSRGRITTRISLRLQNNKPNHSSVPEDSQVTDWPKPNIFQ